MSQPLTAATLLATLRHYYPAGLSVDEDPDAYAASPENRRLADLCRDRFADQSAWRSTTAELRAAFSGWTFWDRTVPSTPCYEARLLEPTTPGAPQRGLVALVSFIAPLHFIYTATWTPGEPPRIEQDPAVPLQPERRRLSDLLGRHLGTTPFPEAWNDLEVPGLRGDWAGHGTTRARDLLFTSSLG